MKVTLEEVAARAGVSLATVSRVLGRRGAVAEATRTKVLEAMSELGYSRSTLLHDAPRRLVAVSAPGNPEHWQVQVCTRVAKALQDHDLLVTRPLVETDPEPLQVAIDAGAVALVTPTLTSLHTDIPCIRVDEQSAAETSVGPVTGGIPSVDAADGSTGQAAAGGRPGAATGPGSADIIAARLDLGGGMTTAFEHLQAIGHRRIGLICNDSGELAVQLIRRFRAEHPARNLGLDLEDWIARVPKSFSGGSRAVLELKDATCTAVIVQSALQLHGALHGLRNRHLQVPRDMSIVGFGDSPTMKFTGPPATVLGLDVEGLSNALIAATLTTLRITPTGLPTVPPVFRPRLIARTSTTAARQ
ncbi:LacI family DNA-binding transcriptional regulator [Brevibacterium spongiae]|uniref:LacI family transcriptional regulator n=1 Tax=Brevibacterium spongiae TaxID=2909672 RepID=A0ABY5SNL3_9MICO|nr:LacI family DNA-binding transcriptional regulator [Brevibacterium spongiae]UVI35486.1 LacI family transcriptional regulator [Brevibacterium spongiae]